MSVSDRMKVHGETVLSDGWGVLKSTRLEWRRADGAILDNVDIQSVQVVRGPQGTLFGKNATGGAIIYTTNKPSDVFEGHVEVDAGNYERQDGQVTVNVPLLL